MSKKHKFDLKALVHDGRLKDGQVLFFVSDPKQTCKVQKQPNGEYKVYIEASKETSTLHAFAQKCLGQEPPNHAAMWFRVENGKTLYELWHQDDLADAA